MIRVSKNAGERFIAKDPDNTLYIAQGQIGVSKHGSTSILSPGYCGCLALIISAKEGGGGLVSHIAETGQKAGANRQEYILQSVNLTLDLAARELGSSQFYVALFRGWPNEVDWDLGLSKDARISGLTDLRPECKLKDFSSFLFNPRKVKLYIPGHVMLADESPQGKASQIIMDRLEAPGVVVTSSLEVPLGRKPMPILTCA